MDEFLISSNVRWTDHVAMIFVGSINNLPWVIGIASADRIVAQFDKPYYLGLLNVANFVSAIFARFVQMYFTSLNFRYNIQFNVNCVLFALGTIVTGIAKEFWLVFISVFLTGYCSTIGESLILGYLNHRKKVTLLKSYSSGTGIAGIIGSAYSLLCMTASISYFWSFIGLSPVFIIYFFGFWWVDRSPDESEDNLSPEPLILQEEKVSFCSSRPIVKAITPVFNIGMIYLLQFIIITNFAHCAVRKEQATEYKYMYSLQNLMFQIGYFITISSLALFRVEKVWALTLAQLGFFVLFFVQAYLKFIPIWFCLVLQFFVGTLGGLSYVNCFNNIMIMTNLSIKEREMATNWGALSYSVGILLSAFWTFAVENTFMKDLVTLTG